MAGGRRHRDLAIGIVLGVVIGLAVVVLFVFVFSEQAVDAPSVDGSSVRSTPAATPGPAVPSGGQGRTPVGSP